MVSGVNYHVKNNGNDLNSGLSDAQAWANHPWMSTYTGNVTLKPGDSVLMKRGDSWSITNPLAPFLIVGQSGNESNHITTTAYGTGPKPVINIATNTNQPVILINGKSYLVFDNLEITHHSSAFNNSSHLQNGIYINDIHTLPPHDIIITDCVIHRIPRIAIYAYGNSYNITIGNARAKTVATSSSHSNHIYDFGYGGVVLCGGNIKTLRSDFMVCYNYIHDPSRMDFPGDCYPIQLTANQDDSDMWPHYSWIRFNLVENVPYYTSIGTHGAAFLYIQDNYVKNSYRNIFVFADNRIKQITDVLDHVYIERNILENPANPVKFSAFITVTTYRVVPTNIYIRDNTIFFSSKPDNYRHTGISLRAADGAEISGNWIYNGPESNPVWNPAIYIHPSSSVFSVKNAVIKGNFIKDWLPLRVEGDNVTGRVDIINNVFYAGTAPTGCIYGTSRLTSAGDIRIYNNTLVSNPSAKSVLVLGGSKAGSNLEIKNNIICASKKENIDYHLPSGTFRGTVHCDFNIYWNSSSPTPFGGKYDLAKWRALGFDLHSMIADPVFEGSNHYTMAEDFRLKGTSPAINAGIDTGLKTDYSDSEINGKPDIGAWEYIEEK